MRATELESHLNQILKPENYRDYCPNGLQVENTKEIKTIALAVSATFEAIEQAAKQGADAILCHHGLFWDGAEQSITGPSYQKIKTLLANDIALLAYHLPLDYHPTLGNSIGLAKALGFDKYSFAASSNLPDLLILETKGTTQGQLGSLIEDKLRRSPTLLSFGPEKINKIGIMTGGAQKYFVEAAKLGVDCYITGEASEQNYGEAQEIGCNFIAAGHYATEQFGVQALGKELQKKGLNSFFIKSENPI